jgi:D-3-phosphoglycerate dehydrogenase
MNKILSVPQGYSEKILQEFDRLDIDMTGPLTREKLLETIPNYQGAIVGDQNQFDEEFFQTATNLKILSRFGAGVNNVDLRAAANHGVFVTNAPGTNSVSVAEHTIGLMLAANKNIAVLDKGIKAGEWPRRLGRGFEFDGKILGQVGFGRIGSLVAAKCRAAFNMDVLVYDPYVPEKTIKQMVSGSKVELDYLLANSDVVSINLPSTEETRWMFDYEKFKKMKNTAILVNTGRGDLLVEADLARAMKEGELFSAGLDVTEKEPPEKDNPLFDLERIVITAHTASFTPEAFERVCHVIFTDQLLVMEGKKPKCACYPPS